MITGRSLAKRRRHREGRIRHSFKSLIEIHEYRAEIAPAAEQSSSSLSRDHMCDLVAAGRFIKDRANSIVATVSSHHFTIIRDLPVWRTFRYIINRIVGAQIQKSARPIELVEATVSSCRNLKNAYIDLRLCNAHTV